MECIDYFQSGQYTDLDHLAGDLDLVFENAKRYNMDESKLYKVSQQQDIIVLCHLKVWLASQFQVTKCTSVQ